jgi:hypothetical protein
MMELFALLRGVSAWSFVMRRWNWVAHGAEGQSEIIRKPGMWFAGKITRVPYLLATHMRLPFAFGDVLICHLATKTIRY